MIWRLPSPLSLKMSAQKDLSLNPFSYAIQWREARASKETNGIFRPPDSSCVLSGHYNDQFPKAQNQDRLYVLYSMAWKLKRSTGYIANIRYEKTGKNSSRPASAQIVLKIPWINAETGKMNHVYARTTAYASAFAPRQISPCSLAHVALGDLAVGIIETPHSDQCSTSLLAWHVPRMEDVIRLSGPQVPEWYEVVLQPKIVADLPQLGGSNFWAAPNSSVLCSLRLELPPADLNVFKEECTKVTEKKEEPRPKAPLTPPPLMKVIKVSSPTTVQGEPVHLPSIPENPSSTKEAMVAALTQTAQDVNAFPSDRVKAQMYLQEAGYLVDETVVNSI